MEKLREKVKTFPNLPGVYVMKDAAGRVLYVGMASRLRSRVSSYFLKDGDGRYQIRFLMSKVQDIEIVLTDNPKEALLLENTLIKKHEPNYNISLRDDKSYVRLKLSVKDAAPRLYVTRKLRKDGGLYFGPYTSASACREVVEFIQNHFRLRNCNDNDYRNRVRPCLQYQMKRCDAPCVGYVSLEDYRKSVEQVRLFLEGRSVELQRRLQAAMAAAAEREEYEEAARLRDLLRAIDVTFEKQKVVKVQEKSRDVLGFHRDGQDATFYVLMFRDGVLQDHRCFFLKAYEEDGEAIESFLLQLYDEGTWIPQELLVSRELPDFEALEEVLSDRAGKKVKLALPQRGEKNHVAQLADRNAQDAWNRRQLQEKSQEAKLLEVKEAFNLKKIPRRIECYDISNFQGDQSIGSMAVFVDGRVKSSLYRRFKIRTIQGSNDFASLYEVLSRRLRRAKEEANPGAWQLPDLILIDGGKGQLGAAAQALKDAEVTEVDLISIAKSRLLSEASATEATRSEERIFLLNHKDPLKLGERHPALRLMIQLRDEAHRFGIEGHRKLRDKKMLASGLDQIAGIGPVRRRRLLQRFESVDGIKNAAVEEVAKILKIPVEKAGEFQRQL